MKHVYAIRVGSKKVKFWVHMYLEIYYVQETWSPWWMEWP